MDKSGSFLRGALVLSVAGALSKILGAIYRIPLARLLGGEGMGLYQMAYPIYHHSRFGYCRCASGYKRVSFP